MLCRPNRAKSEETDWTKLPFVWFVWCLPMLYVHLWSMYRSVWLVEIKIALHTTWRSILAAWCFSQLNSVKRVEVRQISWWWFLWWWWCLWRRQTSHRDVVMIMSRFLLYSFVIIFYQLNSNATLMPMHLSCRISALGCSLFPPSVS